MRGLYAVFDVVVFAGPFVGTLLWLHAFWHGWRRLALAWLTVSLAWIVLDIVSVARGWWEYNTAYIFGPRLFGLPLEEVAFFFVVPFASLVVYCVVSQRVRGMVRLAQARWILAVLASVLILLLLSNVQRERTVFECLVALGTIAVLWWSRLIITKAFWCWNGVVFICCLVFNTVLTAPPIIVYSNQFMLGLRIGTIPVEDFIYNFSLLNLFVIVALAMRNYETTHTASKHPTGTIPS